MDAPQAVPRTSFLSARLSAELAATTNVEKAPSVSSFSAYFATIEVFVDQGYWFLHLMCYSNVQRVDSDTVLRCHLDFIVA